MVITNVKGTPIVSFEEQRDSAQEFIRDKVDYGLRKTNPDGSIARSNYHSAAVNMEWFYDNRFRVKDGKLQIVTAQTSDGWRAIQGAKTGMIGMKQVLAYVFVRDGKNLKYETTVTVSDEEFVTEFTEILDEEGMKEILLQLKNKETSKEKRKLPI